MRGWLAARLSDRAACGNNNTKDGACGKLVMVLVVFAHRDWCFAFHPASETTLGFVRSLVCVGAIGLGRWKEVNFNEEQEFAEKDLRELEMEVRRVGGEGTQGESAGTQGKFGGGDGGEALHANTK